MLELVTKRSARSNFHEWVAATINAQTEEIKRSTATIVAETEEIKRSTATIVANTVPKL
jgi:hypothetical protein